MYFFFGKSLQFGMGTYVLSTILTQSQSSLKGKIMSFLIKALSSFHEAGEYLGKSLCLRLFFFLIWKTIIPALPTPQVIWKGLRRDLKVLWVYKALYKIECIYYYSNLYLLLCHYPPPRTVSPLSLSYIIKQGEQGPHHGSQGGDIYCPNKLQEDLDGQQNDLLICFT